MVIVSSISTSRANKTNHLETGAFRQGKPKDSTLPSIISSQARKVVKRREKIWIAKINDSRKGMSH